MMQLTFTADFYIKAGFYVLLPIFFVMYCYCEFISGKEYQVVLRPLRNALWNWADRMEARGTK